MKIGRLAEREAVGGWTDAGAADDVRNIGVTELLESGERFVDVGLGREDFGIALEGEVDRSGEGYLRACGMTAKANAEHARHRRRMRIILPEIFLETDYKTMVSPFL